MRADVHPYVFASMRPYVSANRPSADVASPGRSRLAWVSSRDSSMKRRLATIPRAPTGTLTKKIQLQSMCSVIRPPTSGPIASASADVPAQIPMAVPRSRGGNVAAMIDSVAGFIKAAPAPCRIRAPMSISEEPASPQRSEASVKTTIPMMNTSLRP